MNPPASGVRTPTSDSKPDEGARPDPRLIWLRAGQDLLRVGGVSAVKIQALQRETGLTTGSFYHHFDGMAPYLVELAQLWGRDTPDHLAEAAEAPPGERLRRLASIVPREELLSLDMAMRDWAGSYPEAAASVKRVDQTLLTFVARTFQDLGFRTSESRVRAQMWLSFGAARVQPPWSTPRDALDQLIDILSQPPQTD